MLISRVSEGNDPGAGEGRDVSTEDNHIHEYQTASELFEIMAKDQNFDTRDGDPLTTRDLVILYKNIDIGTKLMSNTSEFECKKANQYVETVIYNEDAESDGSDVCDIYSTEDLHNVVMINKERIDLLNNPPSLDNTLCHKFGDIEFQSSDLTTEYDKHSLFKDPYIKEQLHFFQLNSNEYDGSLLPASLLDYICCKRLEDNYNFYMDNMIQYVKNTIEQLKRISNGDYLTDRAKEKWKEVENVNKDHNQKTKVLAASTSIPSHVERKTSGNASTWDDIVHSEVDVRSLSKILEKKIVVEVPKLICGSYRLFSKRCADNLIISCKRENQPVIDEGKEEESRVDVVFQLERSKSGQVISNISSIMILQTTPNVRDNYVTEPLPLPYKKIEDSIIDSDANGVKIIEIEEDYDGNPNTEPSICHDDTVESRDDYFGDEENHNDSALDTNDYPCSENDLNASQNYSYEESSESSDALRDVIDKHSKTSTDASVNIVSPERLRLTMQRLNMQTSLPEESTEDLSSNTNTTSKRKSPTRVRIKSPYENKSFILEEKKRKKLLEIREKREKKKQALGDICKITKHKYGKSAVMAQPSSSVTQLSITNKSFYNSIYGQAMTIDNNKTSNGKGCKVRRKDSIPEVSLDQIEGEYESPMLTPDNNSNKYINRSYYLDDAETEMMLTQIKMNKNDDPKDCSASTSAVSSDFCDNLTLFTQLVGPSALDINAKEEPASPGAKPQRLDAILSPETEKKSQPKDIGASQSISNMTPSDDPQDIPMNDINDPKNSIIPSTSSVECRKSIDKIYDLMKKLGKIDAIEVKELKSKFKTSTVNKINVIGGRKSSTIQGSDSGTSLKHHLTSSNPSCFSFENNNALDLPKTKTAMNKNSVTPVVPKVIISTKLHTPNIEGDKIKRSKRPIISPQNHSENPLKAISQLLHEFENVQKVRQKTVDPKVNKKLEAVPTDARSISHQGAFKRRSRFDQHLKDNELFDRGTKMTTPRKPKMEAPKIPHQQIPVDDKNDRVSKRKIITDIIDEAKEAGGEAVRGPCKFVSRLNSLAQPKRSYVQAHSEEYQTRYGRNLMSNRLQKLAALPPPVMERTLGSANSRNKLKRSGTEAASAVSVKSPHVAPLDKVIRVVRSASCSPDGKAPPLATPVCKQKLPQTPETIKKMMTVESYVKSHYGRAPAPSELPQPERRSRVPLLPADMELASITSTNTAEESTKLGSKLHRMIDSMINASPPPLTVLAEALETSSKSSRNTESLSLADNLSKSDERMSADSDYPVDIFEDKNVITAVERVPRKDNDEAVKYDIQPFNSLTAMEKVEHALYRQISVGNFRKRLRIKNFTLTPKRSMQQVFVLQGGDAGSILFESTLSQNLITKDAEKLPYLKALPVLTKSHLDWSFANIPMHIATVGYAFPQYHSVQCGNSSNITSQKKVSKSIETVGNDSNKNSAQSDKVSQCFKGGHPKPRIEQAAKVDGQDVATTNINVPKKRKDIELSPQKIEAKPIDDLKAQTIEKAEKCNDEREKNPMEISDDNVDYTTSLDLLVGLLDEIQKITTCQKHITDTDSNEFQCKELETILNDAAALEHCAKPSPQDIVSITSLDKLRQLDSNPSIYTFYLSSDGEQDTDNNSRMILKDDICKPVCDKEVNVDFAEREYVNRFTDVPSHFPITLNHSTNVTNSLIGVLSKPSSQSMYSFMDYQTLYSNSSFNTREMLIELPQTAKKENGSPLSLVPYQVRNKNITETLNNDNTSSANVVVVVKESTPVAINVIVDKGPMSAAVSKDLMVEKHNIHNQMAKEGYYVSDFDPTLKMKRDILVTVYSILVFSVFAVLSFPQILYQV